MKKINCWNDLAPFGIEILTGEACGLSYRLLCDVTEKGRKVLSVAFGIPDFTLAEAWNTGTKEEPHIGSILLADFPHHQLEAYLHKLLKAGLRVAVCDQVEESLARGPIKREVRRVVVPVRAHSGPALFDAWASAFVKIRAARTAHALTSSL